MDVEARGKVTLSILGYQSKHGGMIIVSILKTDVGVFYSKRGGGHPTCRMFLIGKSNVASGFDDGVVDGARLMPVGIQE